MTVRRTGRSNSSREEKGQLDNDDSLGAGARAPVATNMPTDEVNEDGSQRHENRAACSVENNARENAGDSLELAIKKISVKLDKIAMDTENHGETIAAMRSRSILEHHSRNMDKNSRRNDFDIGVDNVECAWNEKECWSSYGHTPGDCHCASSCKDKVWGENEVHSVEAHLKFIKLGLRDLGASELKMANFLMSNAPGAICYVIFT